MYISMNTTIARQTIKTYTYVYCLCSVANILKVACPNKWFGGGVEVS